MFDNLVATCAVTDEILEPVGFSVACYAKLTECFDVVNIKLLSQLGFACSASLAQIATPMSGITALLPPVGTIVRFIAALPCSTIDARRVARGALP